MTLRFCIDCRFHRYAPDVPATEALCAHPDHVDQVTGLPLRTCRSLREGEMSMRYYPLPGKWPDCGRDGKLFAPKDGSA